MHIQLIGICMTTNTSAASLGVPLPGTAIRVFAHFKACYSCIMCCTVSDTRHRYLLLYVHLHMWYCLVYILPWDEHNIKNKKYWWSTNACMHNKKGMYMYFICIIIQGITAYVINLCTTHHWVELYHKHGTWFVPEYGICVWCVLAYPQLTRVWSSAAVAHHLTVWPLQRPLVSYQNFNK